MKWEKSEAGYLHQKGTQYECGDCAFYLRAKDRCLLHKRDAVINWYGSCNYYLAGAPFGALPLGALTKEVSGYGENLAKVGFSCKRCEYYQNYDCSRVDPRSTGDDDGIIHPDACCNHWEADGVRSKLPTMVFSIQKAKTL